MNRRGFFEQLASGLLVVAAPAIFVPKLIKPAWKPARLVVPSVYVYVCDMSLLPDGWAATVMSSAKMTADMLKRAHPNPKVPKLKQDWFVDWEPAQTYTSA